MYTVATAAVATAPRRSALDGLVVDNYSPALLERSRILPAVHSISDAGIDELLAELQQSGSSPALLELFDIRLYRLVNCLSDSSLVILLLCYSPAVPLCSSVPDLLLVVC
jgi:hypothetical protein